MNSIEPITNQMEAPKTLKKIKTLKGFVVSTKNHKTIVVRVELKTKHRKYQKLVITHKKCHVHDEHGLAQDGDFVLISETRPISALKCWKLKKILVKAK